MITDSKIKGLTKIIKSE